MTEEYHEGVADGIHGTIYWNDGTRSKLAFTRYRNGHERHATRVDVDGVRFMPRPERDWDGVCE